MLPRNVHLLIALGVCGALYALMVRVSRITPAEPGIAAKIEGVFQRDGQVPGEALARADGVRFWGSWAGSDTNVGSLTLGPFPAPAQLHIAVGGYPAQKGNEIYLELAGTDEREPIPIVLNIGERWNVLDVGVPARWIGQPIDLVARDGSKEVGGWLSISEPLHGVRGEGNNGLIVTLAVASVQGLLLALLWSAALAVIARRRWVPVPWQPLVAAGIVASLGYAAFWIFLASATAGKIFSFSLLAAAFARGAWRGAGPGPVHREHRLAAGLLLAVVFFYLALLHLFPSSRGLYDLEANRFREGLPGDNTLPHNATVSLFAGQPLRVPGADWLSSDRPPLQTGWQLLTHPVAMALRMDPITATAVSAIWLQSLWIFAAYGLLRALRLPPARAGAWITVMALSGFLVQNTLFTWPKLSAAAFAGGAFGLWVLPKKGGRRWPEFLLGAVLAALAWLSHGGVAFSFLALVPWFAWRARRGEAWRCAAAAGVFLLFAVPWLCYQKYYDPPGNRLLKWHLAGQQPKDARGTWQAIREDYRRQGWDETLTAKLENLQTQIDGDWRSLFSVRLADATTRRHNEFFYPARAFTWWWLALAALPLLAVRRRRLKPIAFSASVALGGWVLATTVIWCLLMFGGKEAVIHQGSYAVMLTLFVLLSAGLDFISRWSLAVIALLQTVTFATTWALPNTVIQGPPVKLALALMTVGAFFLARFVLAGLRAAPRATPAGTGGPPVRRGDVRPVKAPGNSSLARNAAAELS